MDLPLRGHGHDGVPTYGLRSYVMLCLVLWLPCGCLVNELYWYCLVTVLSCFALCCLVLSCRVVSCSCRVMSCRILSCFVLSCVVLCCLVLSCVVLCCLVLSCLALPCLDSIRLALLYLVLSRLVLSCFLVFILCLSLFLSLFVLGGLVLYRSILWLSCLSAHGSVTLPRSRNVVAAGALCCRCRCLRLVFPLSCWRLVSVVVLGTSGWLSCVCHFS